MSVKQQWIIKDWAGNVKFNGRAFPSFEKAEAVLVTLLGADYDTDRQEFDIVLVEQESTGVDALKRLYG